MNIVKQGKELRSLGFGFNASFTLPLYDQTELRVEKVLRLIPGRRMVVAGHWQNKRVVAKLFMDKRHAARHLAEELAGSQLLSERNIPTPFIYAENKSEDGVVLALLFEELASEINLASAWQHRNVRAEVLPLLKVLVVEIATQHVFGLVQHDLHLNNFILSKNIIYTLDGAQIDIFPHILPKKQSMGNLALLLSQLGAGAKHYQEELFKHYTKARGWIWKQKDLTDLFEMIDGWNKERWEKFEKKIFRNSTQFRRSANWRQESMCDRQYAQPELLHFMQHPELVFKRDDKTMLKDGRSSTVIRVTLDGREYVIKRYNIKHVGHWLRRCFRSTRAKKCWRLAQKLELFGIRTAKPIAYIETKVLGLRGKSYFVTEYVLAENIKEYLKNQASDKSRSNKIISQIKEVISGLYSLAITHGDLKATNILVDSNQEVVLIDLDGAKEHNSTLTLRRTMRQEWQRFLQNFSDEPTLLKRMPQRM